MNDIPLTRIDQALDRFMQWLEGYGETSWDHQTYFSTRVGAKAKELYYTKPKLGTLAVAPMILSEAFVPSARRLFGPRLRFPIADAHYAMGFAFLSRVRGDEKLHGRAVHFLEELEKERCPEYKHWGWGYPFDWETRGGTIRKNTPLITSTPYVYEAFREAYLLDGNSRWREAMISIVSHVTEDIKDYPFSKTASTCSYTPFDDGGTINASAYRAFMLTSASRDFNEERYWNIAERNLNLVLETQQKNGSWLYSVKAPGAFVDHFHTCFVLKALAKIDCLRPTPACGNAIERGVEYYLSNLVDENGLPKPFSKAPRMTVYRRELYDYAECINLCILLRDKIPALDSLLRRVITEILERWIKSDGSFRARELWVGWDNVPMHRWAQSQMFRALSLLVLNERTRTAVGSTHA